MATSRRTIWAAGWLALVVLWAPGCRMLGPLSPTSGLERAIIFHPHPFPEEAWGETRGVFEDAWFESRNGARLHGLFIDHPNPRAVALFCHGNADTVATCAESMLLLNQRHGLAVMIFDYQGYGRSEGRPSEQGVFDDARAARRWLARRTGIDESQVVLMGRSLGGAVATDLAARDGARGLVLASTFDSMPSLAQTHVPLLLPNLSMTNRFDSIDKISSYRGPLLQSHGDADRLIPIELALDLFHASPSQQKRFVVIPNAGHNDPTDENYRQIFDEFIESLRPVAAAPL
ncbi:MAG: alpha/beta fold hydrolase [Planctomycetales bacterium]|nr:alpha/beta fold hydrolase [Planctomycetales bacterium]